MFRSEQNKKIYRRIKSLMILSGVKQSDIARKAGVSQSSISQTIIGKIDSRKIKEEIAKALRKPIEELWPNAEM